MSADQLLVVVAWFGMLDLVRNLFSDIAANATSFSKINKTLVARFQWNIRMTRDWSLLEKYDQSVPFFLSGGISPENVSSVKQLNNLNIYTLDVNSGVEVSPGLKDVNKVQELKRAIDSL